MIMKKNLEEYIEERLLEMCSLCIGDREREENYKFSRAKNTAKNITNYIKNRWELIEKK